MKKRQATTELNHDNWDQEEEAEEAGVMTVAPPEELSKRKIITAKRKVRGSSSNQSSLFAGFGGFGNKTPTLSASSPFPQSGTGNANPTSGNSGKFGGLGGGSSVQFGTMNNGSQPKVTSTLANLSPSKYSRSPLNSGESRSVPSFNQGDNAPSLTFSGTHQIKTTVTTSSVKRHRPEQSSQMMANPALAGTISSSSTIAAKRNEPFCQELKALNMSVLSWIQQHVQNDPHIDLGPIFSDYTTHLAAIERKYAEGGPRSASPTLQNSSSTGKKSGSVSSTMTLSFGKKAEEGEKSPEIINIGTPEKKEPEEEEEKKDVPKISFGLPAWNTNSDSIKSGGFSFGSSNANSSELSKSKPVADGNSSQTRNGPSTMFGLNAGDKSQALFPPKTNTSQSKESDAKTSTAAKTPVFAFTRSEPSKTDEKEEGKGSAVGSEKNLFGNSSATDGGKKSSLFGNSTGSTMPPAIGTNSIFGLSGGNGMFGSTATNPGSNATATFSFGAVSAPVGGSTGAAGTDDEPYEPPKVDSVEVEEEDAFYKTKCKLFFKQAEQYKEKGVGTLYLKPADSGKTQLLIRAATALGNVLLNIALSESIPASRLGKNNVSLVCVPNPPLDPKGPEETEPRVLLIRVKTGEDADDLLDKITSAKSNK